MNATNARIAGLLEEIAEAMRSTGANQYKLRAYERAAESIARSDAPLAERYESAGEEALTSVSGVGQGIARVIGEFLSTGRSTLLDDLKAKASPERLYREIPGIGPELAGRIAGELGVTTLEELERAAHDGRLEEVDGVGEERAQLVRDHLQAHLTRSRRTPSEAPDEETLLAVDQEYRERAERDELRRIAPRRFNPGHERWLPVMETERDGWHFSALFSNTARAHDEGKTHDWVVIYWERDGAKGQNTVVTAERGNRKGLRVVAK